MTEDRASTRLGNGSVSPSHLTYNAQRWVWQRLQVFSIGSGEYENCITLKHLRPQISSRQVIRQPRPALALQLFASHSNLMSNALLTADPYETGLYAN